MNTTDVLALRLELRRLTHAVERLNRRIGQYIPIPEVDIVPEIAGVYGPEVEAKLEHILEVTCREFSVHTQAVRGRCRTETLVKPRHVTWWFARRLLPKVSTPYLAAFLGRQDHNSCLHGCKAVDNRISTDPGFRMRVESIARALSA